MLKRFWIDVCREDPGTLATWVFFLLVETSLVTLSFVDVGEVRDGALNCAVIIVGSAMGWMVGVVLSADSSGQAGRFERAGTALASILTGYVVAKGEPSIAKLLEPGFLFTPLVGFRVLAFVGSTLASTILVFVHREYGRAPCANCKLKNQVDAKFCRGCGTSLSRPGEGET
jgi:hypothetical protein